MRTLAVVPARAGSKGLPGKNSRDFCGRPLAAWAIEVAQRTCDRVCVTSDDPVILGLACEYHADALERPAELAQDDTPMLSVLRHALGCQSEPADVVVLLQPTSPLRTAEQVRQALLLLEHDPYADSVASVVQIPAHMAPDYACVLSDGLLIVPLTTRRQDCRPAFYRDGTVYAMRSELLRDGFMYGLCVPLLLDVDETCTIDTEADWAQAEQLWRSKCSSV